MVQVQPPQPQNRLISHEIRRFFFTFGPKRFPEKLCDFTKFAVDPNRDPYGSKNAPGGGNTASGLFRFRGRFFCLQCCRQDPFHGFCCLLLGCYCDMGISVQGEPALKYPSIPDTTLVSTPFWKASVAKVCRRSWNLTRGSPARFSTWWSKLSGEMGPPVGEGNTQGLLTVFFLCCFRTWMVSSACGSVR